MSSIPTFCRGVAEQRALEMGDGAWSVGNAMRDVRFPLVAVRQKKLAAAFGVRCGAADLKEVIKRVLVM